MTHGNTRAGTIDTTVDGHTVASDDLCEVGTRHLHRRAGDAREEGALRGAFGVRGSNTLGALGTCVEALVQVRSTSSLAETSLGESEGSTSVGNVSLNLEGDWAVRTLNNRLGSVGVWSEVSHGILNNAREILQVGAAEEEVEVALPEGCELVTIGVVGTAEPVVEPIELVRSTELLVDDMVLFDAVDELWYWAAAEPMRATAMVTNVFFIVLMS